MDAKLAILTLIYFDFESTCHSNTATMHAYTYFIYFCKYRRHNVKTGYLKKHKNQNWVSPLAVNLISNANQIEISHYPKKRYPVLIFVLLEIQF